MPVLRVAGAVLLMVDVGCGVGLALLRSAAVVVIRNVDSMDCNRICICFIWNFSVWAVSSSEESEREEELEEEEEYMMQDQQQVWIFPTIEVRRHFFLSIKFCRKLLFR